MAFLKGNGGSPGLARTTSAPSLQTAWTVSFRYYIGGAGDAIMFFFGDASLYSNPYVMLARYLGNLYLEFNGSNVTTTAPADTTDYHYYLRYDGTNIRVYQDGVLALTSGSITYGAGADLFSFFIDGAGTNAPSGSRLAIPKIWQSDEGTLRIAAEGSYRNPQGGTPWAYWHGLNGSLLTDTSGNARDLVGTYGGGSPDIAFTADPAGVLGDDPGGGGGTPGNAAYFRRRRGIFTL